MKGKNRSEHEREEQKIQGYKIKVSRDETGYIAMGSSDPISCIHL
jgi:hypothetical protein